MSKFAIGKLNEEIKRVEKLLAAECAGTYPIGSRCFYQHLSRQIRGGGIEQLEIECEVIAHHFDFGRNIVIENIHTGKQRRVDAASDSLRPA